MPEKKKPRRRLPAGIRAQGFVSLLMDVSSELIHSLLPVFLVTGLGAFRKPLFALATSAEPVVARLPDRAGKDIRGAPRDALVANLAPPASRGTAHGMFNLLSGLALLRASALAGLLWDRWRAPCTFALGAVFGLLALVLPVRHRPPPAQHR